MRLKLILFVSLIFTYTSSSKAQVEKKMDQIQAKQIENIILKDGEIGNGFLVFQENIFKPNDEALGQIRQCKKRNTLDSDLELIEYETIDIGEVVGASCTQKWYGKSKKEKIEFDIIICPSDDEIEKTIELFTKKMYSLQFKETEIPFAGEKSWIAKELDEESNSHSIMFLKANVFVRIYINLNNKNSDILLASVKNLASNIEEKIQSELKN